LAQTSTGKGALIETFPKDLPQQISKWVADNAGASDDGYDSYTVPFGNHSSLDSIEMTDVGDGSKSGPQYLEMRLPLYPP